MRLWTFFLTIALTTLLTHCTSYDFSRRVVTQGNLLPSVKIERLRLGMSKQDVATLMGTSLLSPMFNNDRWDYVNTLRRGSSSPQVRNLSLYFHNGRLVRIERHPNRTDQLHP